MGMQGDGRHVQERLITQRDFRPHGSTAQSGLQTDELGSNGIHDLTHRLLGIERALLSRPHILLGVRQLSLRGSDSRFSSC
jgi:hypothetical protein